MQPIVAGSQIFQPDQRIAYEVDYWPSAFATVENDLASGGIVTDLYEPKVAGAWGSVLTGLPTATAGTEISGVISPSSALQAVFTSGRVANLADYWGAGAPGHHGAGIAGQVLYHWRLYLRDPTGRSWFDGATNPTFTLAFAGQGYVKVTKTISGVTTNVKYQTGTPFGGSNIGGTSYSNDALSERDFLVNGYRFSETISTMAAGDYLDIYYVQNAEVWGGYAFKVIQGT